MSGSGDDNGKTTGNYQALEMKGKARKLLLGFCLAEGAAEDFDPALFAGHPEERIYSAVRALASAGSPVKGMPLLEHLLAEGAIQSQGNPSAPLPASAVAEIESLYAKEGPVVREEDGRSYSFAYLQGLILAESEEAETVRPMVEVPAPVGDLARIMGDHLRPRPIFYKPSSETVVTVSEDGTERAMRADRFASWLERWVTPFRWKKSGKDDYEEKPVTIGAQLTAQLLASDQFRERLRPLAGVNRARLPVLRASGEIEILPAGYDAESETFTVDGMPYAHDMDIDDAREWFLEILSEWPWSEAGQLVERRSAAVQLGAMVGYYCRLLFPSSTLRPMIVHKANQPGSGKSVLVSMILAPEHGFVAFGDLPSNKEEFRKALDTHAQVGSPYVVFDDIGGGIFSNSLNRFVTSPRHTGRKLGGNDELFDVANVSQVFATGNDIRFTEDLERRSLVVDLFVAGEAAERTFTQVIDPEYLATPAVRAKTLAALWAAVREWDAAGRTPCTGTPKGSFTRWTATVAAIVQDLGFTDPLAPTDLAMGGDEEGRGFRQLLTALAEDMQEDGKQDFNRTELVEKARALGVLEELVGTDEDPDLKADKYLSFGRRLAKWKGREFPVGQDGRVFEFGARKGNRSTIYSCRKWKP